MGKFLVSFVHLENAWSFEFVPSSENCFLKMEGKSIEKSLDCAQRFFRIVCMWIERLEMNDGLIKLGRSIGPPRVAEGIKPF